MELDVTQALIRPGETFPFQAKVNVSPQTVDNDPVTFDEVSITGTVSAMDGAILLRGILRTTAHAPCAMCLGEADYPMELAFRETFRKDAIETEDEAFSYQGSAVSLDHLSLTLLMLNLPMRFLCDENCRGGKELQAYSTVTESSCQEDTQRPFEALKRLLEEDEEV
jgi:uncharacterized metal-binding protein YceD (DUF177 family)